jgi:hypothetical protein
MFACALVPGTTVRAATAISRFLLSALLAIWSAAAPAAVTDACTGAMMQGLLNTPLDQDPRQMVYVLEVMARYPSMGTCNVHGEAANLFADHLERLYLNEFLHETVPHANTVREAIELEHELQYQNDGYDMGLRKTQQHAFTRSFASQLWRAGEALPAEIARLPQMYEQRAPGVWNSKSQVPNPVAIAIAFTNVSPWTLSWPFTQLGLKERVGERFVSLSCNPIVENQGSNRLRAIAPGQQIVTDCAVDADQWQSDDSGLAWLRTLDDRSKWILVSQDSAANTDGPDRYARIIQRFGSVQSADKAARIAVASTCEERKTCDIERIDHQDRSVLGLTRIGWLPGLFVGPVLLLCLVWIMGRENAARAARILTGLLTAALVVVYYEVANMHDGGMGLGSVFLLALAVATYGSLLISIWVCYAAISRRRTVETD